MIFTIHKLNRTMKKQLLIASFFLIFSGAMHAQAQLPLGYYLRETIDFYNMNHFAEGKWKTDYTESNIKGSPYLNNEFVTGTIYTTQKQQYNGIPLRYNIYNDDLEFKKPSEEVLALAAPEIVEYAVFGENILSFSDYYQGNKVKKGFLLVLEPGKASLMAKASVTFQKATEPAAYKDAEPAKFIRKADTYYIRIGNTTAVEISNKKSLLEAFPDNRDKVEAFIDKNKIKTNKAESLKEVVKYYNSL